jgi:hypothetical protein
MNYCYRSMTRTHGKLVPPYHFWQTPNCRVDGRSHRERKQNKSKRANASYGRDHTPALLFLGRGKGGEHKVRPWVSAERFVLRQYNFGWIGDPRLRQMLPQRQCAINPATIASSSNATIFVILIIGFTAGPAVSL